MRPSEKILGTLALAALGTALVLGVRATGIKQDPSGSDAGRTKLEKDAWDTEQRARKLERDVADALGRAATDEQEAARIAGTPSDFRPTAIRARRLYDPFATEHHLTSAQLNQLASIMANPRDLTASNAIAAERTAAKVTQASDPARWQEFQNRIVEATRAATSHDNDPQVKAVIGEENMEAFRKYPLTLATNDEFSVVLLPQLHGAGIDLDAAQSAQFLGVLTAESPAVAIDSTNLPGDFRMSANMTITSGVVELIQKGRLSDAVLDKAVAFLSPQQIAGIRQFATLHRTMAEIAGGAPGANIFKTPSRP